MESLRDAVIIRNADTQRSKRKIKEGDIYMPAVNEIRSFPFNEDGLVQVRTTKGGKSEI